jgi:hypothetical protein
MGKRWSSVTVVVMLLFLSVFTNGTVVVLPIVKIAEAVDIITWSDTNTTINVTVERIEPRINWYDFQNSTNVSKLNSRIDVEEEYKFCVDITSDQGWSDIDYINITAWFDNGTESSTYNQTEGGNLNMFLQYENTTGVAQFRLLWPDDEVILGSLAETVVDANTHNLTFSFTPRYQVRYAPGDGAWDTVAGHNDSWSWNFNITVTDASGNSDYAEDEYGVYMFSQIRQCLENPSGSGSPGENDIVLSPQTNVTTRCNANYSLFTNLPNLTDGMGNYIQNTSISAEGGNLPRTNFDGSNPLYLYGSASTYRNHLNNTIQDSVYVQYWVNLSIGVLPGNYSATVTYTITGET